MSEIDVNTMIWGIFMSATMKAAVHLGQAYQDNFHITKNTDFEKIKQLFKFLRNLSMIKVESVWDIYD